jgi:hypothetical protein
MGTGHGEKLARKFELAIASLLDRPTIAEAAEAVGVDESTLRTWLKDPTFRDAYRQARAAILERTVSRLLAATVKAVEALERNLDAARAADQLKAASLILEHARRGVEVLDLVEEVQELKARVAEVGRPDPGAGDGGLGAWRPRPLGNGRDDPGPPARPAPEADEPDPGPDLPGGGDDPGFVPLFT